jgi:hypothetical protein
MFGVAVLAGRKAGKRRPSSIIRMGFGLLTTGLGRVSRIGSVSWVRA